MPDFTFNLLSDNPIYEEDYDRFDHKTIANTIVKTIENAPSPFTFGLFGKWGVGKTSIINLMEHKLPEDNTTIYFDCWKYQNDSLRRAFLLTLENDLKQKNILKDYDVRKKLYQTVVETKNVHTRYNWKRFRKLLPSLAIAYVSSLIVLFITGSINQRKLNPFKFGVLSFFEIIILSLIIPLLHFFSSNIDNIIVSDIRQEMENSLDSPERFEEAFKEIIDTAEAKKFVFVFDNIDRSDSKRVVETLSTIQTFLDIPLDKKNLIFIIPCDDEAIKQHVVKNYEQISLDTNKDQPSTKTDQSNKYADEFLRKFFNSYMQIPGFRDLELVKLARSLLQSTMIPSFNREGLDAVVSNPFRKNPRQIKQFINLLISNYILIQQRRDLEQNDESMLDPIITDVRILAKYLILKTTFSEHYQSIFENNFEIEPDDPQFKNDDDLVNFLNSTRSVNLQPHFQILHYMKVSSTEREIPNYRALEEALINRNLDGIKLEFEKLYSNENERTEKLSSYYDGLRQTIVENKNVPTHLQNIIESTLYISKEFDLTFPIWVMNTVCTELISLDDTYFYATPLDKIFQQLVPFVSTSVLDVLINKFIIRIKDITRGEGDENLIFDKYERELVENLISYFNSKNEINEESKKLINLLFKRLLKDNYNIISILNDRPYMCSKIIDTAILNTLINRLEYAEGNFSMNFEDVSIDFWEFSFILEKSQKFSIKLLEQIVEKFISYLQLEASQSHRDTKIILFRSIETFYESFNSSFTKLNDDIITRTVDQIVANINSPGTDWNNRNIYFPLMTKFLTNASDVTKDVVYSHLNAFLTNSNLVSFESFWKQINKRDQIMILSQSGFVQNLQTAVENDFAYFITIWNLDIDDLLFGVYKGIISSKVHETEMINWLGETIFQPKFPKNNYFNIIIESLSSTSNPEIFKLFTNLINSNLQDVEDRLKTIYVNVLYDSLLNIESREIQEIAGRILTEKQFDKFALTQPTSKFVDGLVRLFGKLDNLIIDKNSYEIPLSYIVENNFLIDKDLSMRDLKQWLFSDFLQKNEITSEIFEWITQLLTSLDVKFTDDPTKFEGVRYAVSRGDKKEITSKTEIFMRLKPKGKLSPEETTFWNEMESLLIPEKVEVEVDPSSDDEVVDE